MDETESDISESVTISALIAVVATAMIFVGIWGGSVPALPAVSTLALAVGIGVAAGGAFYYTGTHETRLDDVPPLAMFLAFAVVVYMLFPEGLPTAAYFAIIVGVWTDTALRAAAKFAESGADTGVTRCPQDSSTSGNCARRTAAMSVSPFPV